MKYNEERRQFYIGTPLRAAKSLMSQLPMDETNYRSVHGTAYADTRTYFLYGVLREVNKVGTSMMRWNSFLDEPRDDRELDQEEREVRNSAIEAMVDEQSFWIRKLTEILVNLICFLETNTHEHYRAFMAATRLRDYLGLNYDFQHFHHCRNENIINSIENWVHMLKEIGQRIDLRQSWFLQDIQGISINTHPGGVFKSIASRFRNAIQTASDQDKVVLGTSYADSISATSRSVHPHIGGLAYYPKMDDLHRNMAHLSMLSLHIILRCYQLLEIEPAGIEEREITRFIEEESIAHELLAQKVSVGDLVIAYADLAEVTKVTQSEYGYYSYKVRYLSRPPIPDVDDEDSFPAKYVQPYVKKDQAREFFRRNIGDDPEYQERLHLLMELSDEDLYEVMKRFFTDMADRGLLGHILYGGQQENG